MPQFFIKDSDFDGKRGVIRGDDCHHLVNVRRIKNGDILRIRLGNGTGYRASVTGISSDEVMLEAFEMTAAETDPVQITLYIALLKGENFEFVLQKAVEVGVARIVPVISSRTVPDLTGKIEKKHQRWSKIVNGAAKQCLRSSIPYIDTPHYFDGILKTDSSMMKLIAHPGADTELRDYLSTSAKPDSAGLLVGPEGGFSENEILSATGNGWTAVNFGTTHLRAETAAVILPSLLIYHWS